jgi:hypothetical protein
MGVRGGDFMQEILRSRSKGAVSVSLIDLSTSTPTMVAHPPTGTAARSATLGRQRNTPSANAPGSSTSNRPARC